jgi:hypothetical protein
MLKRIHVNQHNIKRNAKMAHFSHYEELPVITVKTYKENIKCNDVRILGASRVIYSPDAPLPCGAKVWIETNAEIIVNQKRKVSNLPSHEDIAIIYKKETDK